MIGRRSFFALTITTSVATQVSLVQAQSLAPALRRVGVLAPSTRAKEEVTLKPFFEQMRQLGWIEGQNIAYDRVYADDQQQRLHILAAELVARKPELIYAPPTPAAVAAKQATDAIPIVFGAVWDPVSTGLVASLARPGGNVTGICVLAESLAPKRIQLLREVMPTVKRLGWLGDATDRATRLEYEAFAPQAAALGVTIVFAEAANPPAMEAAIGRLFAQRVDVIYCGTSPLLYNMRERVLELANQQHLPIVAYRESFADAGALFAYGASLVDQLRRSAFTADKILKGAKPADIPVEQATLFQLVVNAKAAKRLGITLPRAILLRADRVIE